MKKILYLSLAIAAMLAVGCTKNRTGNGLEPFPSNADGTAFMSFALNLPTTSATKANDVFDDGTANEYAVENAYLVIFAGTPNADRTNEDDMTLRSAYELNSVGFNTDGSNTQITTSKTITTEVFTENITAGEDAFAFVVLNVHDFFKVAKTSTGVNTFINVQNSNEDLMGKSFGYVKSIVLNEHNKDFSNQSFTMTNMPHVHNLGGIGNNPYDSAHPQPWVLSLINKNNVKPTYGESQAAIAAEIDVERVVAKVSVNSSLTGDQNTVTNELGLHPYGSTDNVKFEILGWFIDNTNETAYLTRNTTEPVTSPYAYLGYQAPGKAFRMASNAAVHLESNGNKVVRTYWGIDPNYNTDAVGLKTEAGKIVNNTIMVFDDAHQLISGRLRALGTDYYCAENTFDVAHMTVKNTTRVIVATRFNGGESFFALKQAPGYIFTDESIKEQLKNMLLSRVNVSNWVSEYLTGTVADALVLNVVGLGKDSSAPGTVTVTLSLADDTTLSGLVKSGKTVAAAKTAWNAIKADQDAFIATNVTPAISFYETGVSYYQALIRHFNDEETPWSAQTGMTNNTESIYEGNDAPKYLGRYSVLRNNWYDINIASVRTLGSPVVPELTEDPDDTVESYITVKINVMPWAKRVQNVIL